MKAAEKYLLRVCDCIDTEYVQYVREQSCSLRLQLTVIFILFLRSGFIDYKSVKDAPSDAFSRLVSFPLIFITRPVLASSSVDLHLVALVVSITAITVILC